MRILAYECIFVDDTDSTPSIITNEATQYDGCVTLIKRSGENARTGLTMAFRRGSALVTMSALISTPPTATSTRVVTLVHTLKNRDVDVTVDVASRYALGGSAEGLDGVFRKIVSRSSNYFVWFLLPPTRKTTDPMTGFFAFKREVLSRVHFSLGIQNTRRAVNRSRYPKGH